MWCGLSPRTRSMCDGEPGVEHQRAEELRRQEDVVVAEHLPLGNVDRRSAEIRPARTRPPPRAPAPRRAAPARRRSAGCRPGRPALAAIACPSAMPVSSTVWWPSTWRSPWASTVRSSSAVPRQRLEHVVEEADAGPHRRLAPAVQIHPDEEIGLLRGAADLADRAAHGASDLPSPRIAPARRAPRPCPRRCRSRSAGTRPARRRPTRRAPGCRARRAAAGTPRAAGRRWQRIRTKLAAVG